MKWLSAEEHLVPKDPCTAQHPSTPPAPEDPMPSAGPPFACTHMHEHIPINKKKKYKEPGTDTSYRLGGGPRPVWKQTSSGLAWA